MSRIDGFSDPERCPECNEFLHEHWRNRRCLPMPVHGANCWKIEHQGNGYLHDEFDDGPFTVDGVDYCGRCHEALPMPETQKRRRKK